MRPRLTEQKLWGALQRALQRRGLSEQATRFEVTTVGGVSDVEYVLCGWHGWVELKVSAAMRESSRLRFGSPFTYEQCKWVLTHHDPPRHLRSWVLIGRGAERWEEFVLLPAPATPILLRPTATFSDLYAARGVQRCVELECVIDWLVS